MSGWKLPEGPAQPRRWPRISGIVGGIVAILAAISMVAIPSAFAHHSEITGSADCDGVVSWNATAWPGSGSGLAYEKSRTNPDVRVWYVIGGGAPVTVANGAFEKANGYQFGGTFDWPSATNTSLTLYVQEQTNWANGTSPSSPRSTTVQLPGGCVPDTGATATCDTVTVTSTKELTNVIRQAQDGTEDHADGLSGTTHSFANNPLNPVVAVWVKSGANAVGPGDPTPTDDFGLPVGAYHHLDVPTGCLGSISFTKVATGNSQPVGATYTITYDDGSGTSGQVSLKAGETKTVEDLPFGSYVIGEASPPVGDDVTITPNPALVDKEHPSVKVTVTNRFAEVGGFSITKQVAGETAGYVPGSTFTVGVVCDNGAVDEVSLAAGETKVASGLPVGTTCVLGEVDKPATTDASYAWDAESFSPSDTVVIAADQTVAVTLTNPIERVVGALEIRKVVSGETDGYVADSTFEFSVDCDGTDHDTTVSLRASETTSLGGIPIGSSCTVHELDVPAAAPGYTYRPPTVDPAAGTVTIGNTTQAVRVLFDNPLEFTAAAAFQVACEQRGEKVTLSNDGGEPVDLTVTKDGDVVETVTVGDTPVDVIVPLDEGESATIEVKAGSRVVGSADVTLDCKDPTTTTTTPGSTTTTAPGSTTTTASEVPTQVLGTTQTPITLPRTGSDTRPLVLVGLAMVSAGGVLVLVARRRREA